MTNIIATDSSQSALSSLEPAIDPGNKPTFLLDWELTLKCNLDCSYCNDSPETGNGHWTLADHPPLNECLKTIDFMFEYVDLYMKYKARWTRAVVLNIYGGESLLHPDIVEILETVKQKYKPYQDRWPLTITTTTNATIGKNTFNKIVDLIDDFTMSYHCESLPKHKQAYKNNVLLAKEKGKRVKCIVLMHQDQKYWPELFDVIDFCKQHDVDYLPRQIDGDRDSIYNTEQVKWFKELYIDRSHNKSKMLQENALDNQQLKEDNVNLTSVGRACCGGRSICANNDFKNPMFYVVGNRFRDWYCSVNWMFLYIKQHDGRIYSNKDCMMNFKNKIDPIGNLNEFQKLIEWTRRQLENNTMPVIQCKKSMCLCGLCAPKASTRSEFDTIMKKHITQDVFE